MSAESSSSNAVVTAVSRLIAASHSVDELRWQLYHGVKRLANTSARKPAAGGVEAKLFYNFLNEKYGEDELTFFLYWFDNW